MKTITILPIYNNNCVTVDLVVASVQANLPRNAAGNTASYYYFQAAKGSMQIRLDANQANPPNFVSKFMLLDGQSQVVRCDEVKRVTVDSLSALPNKLYITALDCN